MLLINFKNNSGIIDNLNMRRQLLPKHVLLFFLIGVKNEDFHRSGKIPDLSNKEVITGVRMNAHLFKNIGKTSSGPIAV